MRTSNSAILIFVLICVLCLVVACAFVAMGTNFQFGLVDLNTNQIVLGVIVFSVSMVIGLIAKLVLDHIQSEAEITWTEYLISGLVIGLLLSFLSVRIAWSVAWNNEVTYREYWNGWEIQAVEEVTVCHRDGDCHHEYRCDPYTVTKMEKCNCDDDGCDTCIRTETEYHQCPFATVEYTHIIKTTIGDFLIDDHVFGASPVLWRSGRDIPNYVQKGPSLLWLQAKSRCDNGSPGPVTARKEYQNYILASESTILKEYNGQISKLREDNMLPDLATLVDNTYFARKVYFVGYSPDSESEWQESLAYFNAAFGNELHGDLHLVIVKTGSEINPDSYIIALKAYWQDDKIWGKDALSKNSVIVVLGTDDGTTVSWARATTGMPLGNETLLTLIKDDLKGSNLSPKVIFGDVKGEFYTKIKDDGSSKTDVRGIGGDEGKLRRLFWGLDNSESKFVRVSMTANDKDDEGMGYRYLVQDISISKSAQFWIVALNVLVSSFVWFVVAMLVGARNKYHSYY